MFSMMHGGWVAALAHAALLLAVSFFVLASLKKQEGQGLKAFGYAVAVLLWVSAALVLGGSLTGRRTVNPMMRGGQWDRPAMRDGQGFRRFEGQRQDGRRDRTRGRDQGGPSDGRSSAGE